MSGLILAELDHWRSNINCRELKSKRAGERTERTEGCRDRGQMGPCTSARSEKRT